MHVKTTTGMNFTVPQSVEATYEILVEVIKENGFLVESFRPQQDTGESKKVDILLEPKDRLRKRQCGMVDLTQDKSGKTLVNFKPARGNYNEASDGRNMDRLFFMFTQKLLQMGIIGVGSETRQ